MPAADIDWMRIERVLVVRLRSIGDAVLTTPSLVALKRFLPKAEIDILLEDWVAPVLEGSDIVNNVLTVSTGWPSRVRAVRDIRRREYDVVFNLHGGTTATFFTWLSGARHRVGLANYQYSFLYNHLLSSPIDFWKTDKLHSAEQMLALLGFVGVPVEDRPLSRLVVTSEADNSMRSKLALSHIGDTSPFALVHPANTLFTKQWALENFAVTAEYLDNIGIAAVAVAAKHESEVLEQLKDRSSVRIVTFDDLTLPEITALAAKAKIFVGNDSGIAHIAAAVGTRAVVIFGSSNRVHWRPWTNTPNEIVYEEFPCQPCAGYECKVFGEPKCILSIKPDAVFEAIDRVLSARIS
jgi:ADP-heptose:LPS heptosyltransferase